MHIPDGFLSPPVWVTLDAVSLPAVGWAARRASRPASDSGLPLLGVMGAFVFAAQMINFPLALGTSAHLLGGALLAIVLGPAAAVAVITAILVLQALVFQDGGVLVLGANIFNLALAGVAAGYLPYRLWGRKPAAMFLGGLLSVLLAGALALAELLASGVPLPARLLWLSLGLFLAGGLLEGAITVAVVRSIDRLRPAGFDHRGPRRGRTPNALASADLASPGNRVYGRGFSRLHAAVALAALLIVAGGVLVASAHPDGIQYVAAQMGLVETPVWSAPLAGYATAGISSAWTGRAGAGLIGLVLIYGIGTLGTRKR